MFGTGYRRVSKNHPCGICGKPDWCSTTTNEPISFCARSTLNADRVSRNGWGVYYHRYSGSEFNRTFYRTPKRKTSIVSSFLASPTLRDRVYRKLIELSPASGCYSIVHGLGGLWERLISDHSQYGSLPKTVYERTGLVERLVIELRKEFGTETASLIGIPGFWKDAKGKTRLWNRFDSNNDLMVIPFVGPDGLTQACQIRFMKYYQNRSGNYLWLSSAKERMGSGPGSPLHHVDPGSRWDKPVLVTEGALKAATAQMFLTDRYVVGNSGVATAHREIVETARGRTLEIAFDNDSFTNPHVAHALAALVRLRHEDQNLLGYEADLRIVTWRRSIKGIDEALLAGTFLEYLTVAEWLKYLTQECLEHASRQMFLK